MSLQSVKWSKKANKHIKWLLEKSRKRSVFFQFIYSYLNDSAFMAVKGFKVVN